MTDRTSELERRLEALAGQVADLARRLSALEDRAPVPSRARESALQGTAAPGSDRVSEQVFSAVGVLSELGRFCLILCGAFLLRHVTESALLPPTVGVCLGLAYAIGWLLVADRSAASGRTLSAVLSASAFAAIAMPLTWEATVRFDVLSAPVAAALLLALGALALVVATRRDARAIAVVTMPLVLLTAFVVAVATRDLVSVASAMLVLGVGTTWLAASRGWHLTRWFAALVVDVLVLQAVLLLARPAGPPEPYAALEVGGVVTVAVVLPIVYLAVFITASILRGTNLGPFEVLQGAAATMIGWYGAVRVLAATSGSLDAVGWLALTTAAAAGSAAFASSALRSNRRAFALITAWGTLVVVWASSVVLPDPLPVLAWCILGIAAGLVGTRMRRSALHAAAVIGVGAAAIESGLLAWSGQVLVGPFTTWEIPGLVALACFAATGITYTLMTVAEDTTLSDRLTTRSARLVTGLIFLVGAAAAAVSGLVAALASVVAPDDAIVGVVRTVVLAGSAVGLALLGRRPELRESGWLVYPVLVAGGLKILLDDLPHGRPVTLFVSFALFGLALILAPRIARRGPASAGTAPAPTRSDGV